MLLLLRLILMAMWQSLVSKIVLLARTGDMKCDMLERSHVNRKENRVMDQFVNKQRRTKKSKGRINGPYCTHTMSTFIDIYGWIVELGAGFRSMRNCEANQNKVATTVWVTNDAIHSTHAFQCIQRLEGVLILYRHRHALGTSTVHYGQPMKEFCLIHTH